MRIKTFKDLNVWQKAHKLTLDVYSITKEFPDNEKFGLVNQMRRSSVSICANIVEGYMKSSNDFTRYLDIARGSLEETKYHIILSKDLQYFSFEQYDILYNEADEVGRMLYKLKLSINNRSRRALTTET